MRPAFVQDAYAQALEEAAEALTKQNGEVVSAKIKKVISTGDYYLIRAFSAYSGTSRSTARVCAHRV